MPTAQELDDIVALTLGREPTRGRTRVVSVDGPAGSGKTTLAGSLAEVFGELGLDVSVLHMDDLYEGWEGLRPDLEPRVIGQILEPIADARPARWQRYDWAAGQLGEWVDQPVPDVLVLEGCGSGAVSYDPFRSALVWVEADRDTRIARGVERDGEQVVPFWLAWMDLEEAHFELNRTRERADLWLRTS